MNKLVRILLHSMMLVLIMTTHDALSQKADFSTPRSAAQSFRDNIESNPYVAAEIISRRHLITRNQRKDRVLMLRDVLKASGLTVDLERFPDDKDYRDSLNDNKHVFPIATNLTLEKIGGEWRLSYTTVKAIPQMWEQIDETNMSLDERLMETKGPQQQGGDPTALVEVVPLDLSNPRESLKVFLSGMDPTTYSPFGASRVINPRDLPNRADRMDRVVMLKKFMDGRGILIDLNDVPDYADYIDSTNLDKPEYVITHRQANIFLEKVGKNWYLSKTTVDAIPALYEQAFPFGMDAWFEFLPDWAEAEILGLHIWQYAAIFLLILISFAITRFLTWFTRVTITRLVFRFGSKDMARSYVGPITRPLGYAVVLLLVSFFQPILMLPVEVSNKVAVGIAILGPVFITMSLYKLMDVFGLYIQKIAKNTDSTLDDQLVPILIKSLKAFAIIIGGIWILNNLEINIVPLLAGLSIGGIAFALAAQDTIKNFFGSVMIFIDKPFQVGHWVTAEGIDGTVEEVGVRSTRIRTFRNSVIYVPNGKLADAVIDNHGLRMFRRFKTHIAVTYDTPADNLELFVKGLRRIIEEHPYTKKDAYHVYMNDMGAHSLNIIFYVFFKAETWALELKYREEIILSIMRLANKLEINFAFPTQTLQIETQPGQPSLAPHYKEVDDLESDFEDFFKKPEGDSGS